MGRRGRKQIEYFFQHLVVGVTEPFSSRIVGFLYHTCIWELILFEYPIFDACKWQWISKIKFSLLLCIFHFLDTWHQASSPYILAMYLKELVYILDKVFYYFWKGINDNSLHVAFWSRCCLLLAWCLNFKTLPLQFLKDFSTIIGIITSCRVWRVVHQVLTGCSVCNS